MPEKYSLTQVLGVWLIFASLIPLLWSVVSIGSFLFLPTSLSYYNVFLLCSPIIMVILGFGLADKKKWARYGAILFMIVSMIVALVSIWFLEISSNSISITVIIIILGILTFDKARSPLSEESGTASTPESTIALG